MDLISKTQGFGVGKALVGGLTMGPWGLLAGGINSDKILLTCKKCGNQFKLGYAVERLKQDTMLKQNSIETKPLNHTCSRYDKEPDIDPTIVIAFVVLALVVGCILLCWV